MSHQFEEKYPKLSHAKSKYIRKLRLKKHRVQEGVFVVEGDKNVCSVLESPLKVIDLIASPTFIRAIQPAVLRKVQNIFEADTSHLTSLGNLESNQVALATVACEPNIPFDLLPNEYVLVLDQMTDPGNLGTIFRIAAWYGIEKIVCSLTTVDRYNPKVIQASVGSFVKVKTFYTNLEKWLSQVNVPVLGAYMEGENVHGFSFPKGGVLIIGNEANGISKKLERYITHRVGIPSYGGGVESLNAAMATAIICDNWKRQEKKTKGESSAP